VRLLGDVFRTLLEFLRICNIQMSTSHGFAHGVVTALKTYKHSSMFVHRNAHSFSGCTGCLTDTRPWQDYHVQSVH
jgi:hypothetical protein